MCRFPREAGARLKCRAEWVEGEPLVSARSCIEQATFEIQARDGERAVLIEGEASDYAVVALPQGRLIIPAKPNIDGEGAGELDVVLKEQAVVLVLVSGVDVPVHRAAARNSQ